jgi:hypothetical protein
MGNRLFFTLTALVVFAATGGSVAWAQETGSDLVIFNSAPIVTLPDPNGSEFAPAFLQAPSNTPDQLIQIFEDSAHTVLSDQFYVQSGFFYFASDPDLQSVTFPIVGNLTETGAFQDVGSVFKSASGGPLLDPNVLGFISDVETVPEPSSILMMTLGVISIAVLARRRSTRASRPDAR